MTTNNRKTGIVYYRNLLHYCINHRHEIIMSREMLLVAVGVLLLSRVDSYDVSSSSSQDDNEAISRRGLGSETLRNLAAGTVAANTLTSLPQEALASSAGDEMDLYFGVGCFWHIQHEFVEGERTILNRGDSQLTSRTGYAGGSKTDEEGRVCYHNSLNIADYGNLGHGEVVGMRLPSSKVAEFADLYFSLYNPKTKDRVDPQDRGGEYRSLIGLNKGIDNQLYKGIAEAASKAGFKLEMGEGNDPDTLGRQLVYVYDSDEFPFHQAEVYHQYHNDFLSPDYGEAYNGLVNLALDDGRIRGTGCPNRA